MLLPIGFNPISPLPQSAASSSRRESEPVDGVVLSDGQPIQPHRRFEAFDPNSQLSQVPGGWMAQVPDSVLLRSTSEWGPGSQAERKAAFQKVGEAIESPTPESFEAWAMASSHLSGAESLGQLADEFVLEHALMRKRGDRPAAIWDEYQSALRYRGPKENRRGVLEVALATEAHPREVQELLGKLKPNAEELKLLATLSPKLERAGRLLEHLREARDITPETAALAARLDLLVPDKLLPESLKLAIQLKPDCLELLGAAMQRVQYRLPAEKVYNALQVPLESPLDERLAVYDKLYQAAIPRKSHGTPLGTYGGAEAAAQDYTLIAESMQPGETLTQAFGRYEGLFAELAKNNDIYSMNFDDARDLQLLHGDRTERYLKYRALCLPGISGNVDAKMLLEAEFAAPGRREAIDTLLAAGVSVSDTRRDLDLFDVAPDPERVKLLVYCHKAMQGELAGGMAAQEAFKLLEEAGPERASVQAYYEQQLALQPKRRSGLTSDLLCCWRQRQPDESLQQTHQRLQQLDIGDEYARRALFEALGARGTPQNLILMSQCYAFTDWKRDEARQLFDQLEGRADGPLTLAGRGEVTGPYGDRMKRVREQLDPERPGLEWRGQQYCRFRALGLDPLEALAWSEQPEKLDGLRQFRKEVYSKQTRTALEAYDWLHAEGPERVVHRRKVLDGFLSSNKPLEEALQACHGEEARLMLSSPPSVSSIKNLGDAIQIGPVRLKRRA
ncbi:MAG: hypothetical protein AMXMBFR33_22180 [Candidatus Xenobia bacterium]